MDKKEEIILEENLNEKEIIEVKSSNKVKYAIAIIASTLILAAATTLLVGHFKFDWFKSDNYKIDVNISRSAYQANYFNEKKTATAKIVLENGVTVDKKYIVNSNFAVYLTDKKQVNNGYLNTAILVILDSKLTSEEVNQDLAHFNIFDENQVKDFESNPKGSKYPMALFKFYEDGTLEDIQLPNNMDEYNAESMVELVEKVIPKLSRSRNEDMSKGLDVKVKRDKKKRIIVQSEAPKEYYSFKGSKYSKLVKTEVEDDQINSIETISSMYLQAEPEEDQIIFGPKEFSFDLNSLITSNEKQTEQKNNVELVQKLAQKYNFINSKDLIDSFKEKEEEKEVEKETEPATRNLGFAISASKTFTIASFTVCGQTVSVKYSVKISSSSCENKVIISSGSGSFEFGNTGAKLSGSKEYKVTIFKFPFPNFPMVTLGAVAKGKVSWEVGVKSGSGSSTKYFAKLTGKVTLGAEIKAGSDKIASLSCGAEGTVIEASGSLTLSNGSVTKDSGFSVGFGGLSAYIQGCLFSAKIEIARFTIFSGWRYA